MPKAAKPNVRVSRGRLALYHALLLGGIFGFWYAMTEPGLIAPFYFDDPTRAKFFFGQPIEVFKRIYTWFVGGSIYLHLGVTLIETLLAFAIGTLLGLMCGLWLALAPTASTLADPYIKAMNAMPRVILAPIFAVWFGLGITSKVVFGITLVFFIVFFNVYQGVKEVSPVVLANARMLGASASNCCATSTCRQRRAGCSPACTRRLVWHSSVLSSANISAPRAAWAISSTRPKACSTSTRSLPAFWC